MQNVGEVKFSTILARDHLASIQSVPVELHPSPYRHMALYTAGNLGWLRKVLAGSRILLAVNARTGRGFGGAPHLFTWSQQYLIRPCAVDEDQTSPCRSLARGRGPASDHSTTWLRSIPAVLLLLDDELYGSRFPVAAYGVTPLLARLTVAHSPGSQVEARVCMCMCSGTARLCTCGLFEPCTPSRAV